METNKHTEPQLYVSKMSKNETKDMFLRLDKILLVESLEPLSIIINSISFLLSLLAKFLTRIGKLFDSLKQGIIIDNSIILN